MELNNEFLKFFLIYYLVINIVGFLSMGLDKYKAKHNHWRIPEKTLLLLSVCVKVKIVFRTNLMTLLEGLKNIANSFCVLMKINIINVLE